MCLATYLWTYMEFSLTRRHGFSVESCSSTASVSSHHTRRSAFGRAQGPCDVQWSAWLPLDSFSGGSLGGGHPRGDRATMLFFDRACETQHTSTQIDRQENRNQACRFRAHRVPVVCGADGRTPANRLFILLINSCRCSLWRWNHWRSRFFSVFKKKKKKTTLPL